MGDHSRKRLFDSLPGASAGSLASHHKDIPLGGDTPPALTQHKPDGASHTTSTAASMDALYSQAYNTQLKQRAKVFIKGLLY